MRKSAVVLIAAFWITACGSPPPSATPSTAKQNVALPTPPPTAPLVDPVGLVTVARPQTSLCELVGKNSFDVSGTADGPALFHLGTGDTKLVIGSQGETFILATTPSFTIRGYVAHEPSSYKSLVYAVKWLSFGGVYFPGIHDAMAVTVHDGKISLTARDDRGFHFTGANGTLDIACDDIALEPDPKGVLQNTLPPAFEKHDGKLSVLKYTKSVSLSADPDGPAVGAFDVREGPATVTVIERKGKKAHVRSGHFIGWVDASALKPFTPSTRKDIDAASGTAMLAAIGGGVGDANEAKAFPKSRTSSPTLVCTKDVRILTAPTSSPSTSFVIGTIPAGKPVHLSAEGDGVSMLVLDDDPENPRVSSYAPNQFAAPNKDLASCVASTDAPPILRLDDDNRAVFDQANKSDAIEHLPAETPKKRSPPSKIENDAGVTNAGAFGPGPGALGASKSPSLRQGAVTIKGKFASDIILGIVRKNFGRFRSCYEAGLARNGGLTGRIMTKFVIGPSGAVSSAVDGGSDLPDPAVLGCVFRYFSTLWFPVPPEGPVTVVYPIVFAPGN